MAYTLIVSGERFEFTKEQLESDPDNYFTTYFFGSFSEASEEKKELAIIKEPALFRLIQAHLRGYDILPIPEGYISYMSKEVVLGNLLKEAEFYALGNLVQKIKDFQVTSSRNLTRSKYKFRSAYGGTLKCTWDLNDAEYHSVLSAGGDRCWGELNNTLKMDGYRVLRSWLDKDTSYYCAILILDE